ncbi:MAG: permease [Clostridiales bacterium]|nr:permease [Clostridiales bacterium]
MTFSVLRYLNIIAAGDFQTFSIVFISILMQAFPFVLIGVFISTAIHVFIPDAFIVRLFPVKNGLGFLTALFAGLFFPVCECAVVPVVTRLVKKGVALPVAVTFMLSAPIVNPVAIISTIYAFPGRPDIMLYRIVFGLLIALITGIVLVLFPAGEPVLRKADEKNSRCGCPEEEHHHFVKHGRTPHAKNEALKKLRIFFTHAGDEFFAVGKYLVFGACMTSLIQTLIPKSIYGSLSSLYTLPLLIMMSAAFLFSACSTSDAFIARSFVGRFSLGSIMGFMVFGPMMDIKNIMMLIAGFKRRFVLKLVLIIVLTNFIVLSYFAFLIK